jgi:ribosomal-protein-alanine acetyltransferase
MRPEDLAAVAGIEEENQSPWSLLSLGRELEAGQGTCLVAEASGVGIIGWCCYRTIWPEVELLKIAVSEKQRKKGIGSILLAHLLHDLQRQNYSTLFLEVRAGNTGARSFYQRHGFYQVGMRPNYYSDPPDDALILKRDIG